MKLAPLFEQADWLDACWHSTTSSTLGCVAFPCGRAQVRGHRASASKRVEQFYFLVALDADGSNYRSAPQPYFSIRFEALIIFS